MAFFSITGRIVPQAIADTSTTRNHPLGTIICARDETFGEGEFIYLQGVASTTVGSIVSYNATTFQTALGVAVSLVPRPMAVSMSANIAAQFGWYQISGIAVCAKSSTGTSFAVGAAVGVLSTATGLAAATASGNELQGALVAAVASAAAGRTTVQVLINRPHMQGRIT